MNKKCSLIRLILFSSILITNFQLQIQAKNILADNIRATNNIQSRVTTITELATIQGNTTILGNTFIGGTTRIGGNTIVGGDTTIAGTTRIAGNTIIEGDTITRGNTYTTGNSIVQGNTIISGSTIITGTLIVDGQITITGGNFVRTEGTTQTNQIPRYIGEDGLTVQTSLVEVDDSGNVRLAGITSMESGETLSWPSIPGASGTFLGSDGNGSLVFSTPAGAGNVSTNEIFNIQNGIAVVDPASGAKNIKQSPVTVSDTGDLSSVNTLSANSINAQTINLSPGGTITGNLIGNVTGAASKNVLKTGDTMTGALDIKGSPINLLNSNLYSIGLQAPPSGTQSYAINLPAISPSGAQVLQTIPGTSPFSTQWITVGGSTPTVTQTYFVSLGGSDTTGDGSVTSPFRTIKHAVDIADPQSSLATPVVINVGAGIFTEDKITIAHDALTVIGNSLSSTIIMPNDASKDLFYITAPNVQVSNLSMRVNPPAVSSAAAIKFLNTTYPGYAEFMSLTIIGFYKAFDMTSTLTYCPVFMENVQTTDNGIAAILNNVQASIKSCVFNGSYPSTTYYGIIATGINSRISIIASVLRYFAIAAEITGNGTENSAVLGLSSVNMESNINSISCYNGSTTYINGLSSVTNLPNSVNIYAQDRFTKVYVEGALIDGKDAVSQIATGTAVIASNGATVNLNSSNIESMGLGIQAGTVGDVYAANINSDGTNLKDCNLDLLQIGQATINFSSGTITDPQFFFQDESKVSIATFNNIGNKTLLSFGSDFDTEQTLYQIKNGKPIPPALTYQPNYYGYKGTVYKNQNTGANSTPSFTGIISNKNTVGNFAITQDRSKEAGIKLVSDTSNTVGDGTSVRGWDINKIGTGADLAFKFYNTDTVGQSHIATYTVMQLNGFDNTIIFPTDTNITGQPTNAIAKLVWAPETDTNTNLYRKPATPNTLRTDANFTAGNLTSDQLNPNIAVATDSNGNLASSATTATELGYVHGVTSSVQTQLNNKVSKTGDTMSGTLTLATTAPSVQALNFTDNLGYGLSAQNSVLSIDANNLPAIQINSTQDITLNKFGATAGILHNLSSGKLGNSLIVNNDVASNAAIQDTKLATIITAGKVANSATTATGPNVPQAIVARDINGNFSAGTITASLAGNADTATNATYFTTALSGDATGGNLGSTTTILYVGGQSAYNVATGAYAANNATPDNTPGTIVKRNASGGFSGSLDGAASENVLKTGDTMTGPLNMTYNTPVKFTDFFETKSVSLQAPYSVSGNSYAVQLPAAAPIANQFLQVTNGSSPYTTQWTTVNGNPDATYNFYVSKSGSNSNNGSVWAPYKTVSYAISQANLITSTTTPVAINVGPGIFEEDNSGDPILINGSGISIIGASISATTIKPNTYNKDLFRANVADFGFYNIALDGTPTSTTISGSQASAFAMNTNGPGGIIFHMTSISSFQTGLSLNYGYGNPPTTFIGHCKFINNGTGISVDNLPIVIKNIVAQGTLDYSSQNTAINLSGSNTHAYISDVTLNYFNNGISVSNFSDLHLLSSLIQSTNNSVYCNKAKAQIIGCNFVINNPTTINVFVTDPEAKVYVEGCLFDCEDLSENTQGTCLKATNGAKIVADNDTLDEAVIAIQAGEVGDVNAPTIIASNITIRDCNTNIKQVGNAIINFTGGKFDTNKVDLQNNQYVKISSFDTSGDLSFGNTSPITTGIYKISTGQPIAPALIYEPNYYGCRGTIYKNQNTGANSFPAFSGVQSDENNASYFLLTGDRSKEATITLKSDAGNFGSPDYTRGWDIAKTSTGADLAFRFSNNDIVGKSTIATYTVMQLNGFDNTIIFPTDTSSPAPSNLNTKLVWAPDTDANTNLYRKPATPNTLRTDANFSAGNLTSDALTSYPNMAIKTDANSNLAPSTTTATELEYVHGVTSAIQTQINSKVSKSGDTMTGSLNMGGQNITNVNTITTSNLNVSTNASFTGPLNMNNNNITAVNNLWATGANIKNLNASGANITGNLNMNNFNINNISAINMVGDINMGGNNINNSNFISGNIINATGINASGANIYGTLNMGNNTINTGTVNANINTNSLNASGAIINGPAGLDMGNNNITNANNITATGINASGANIYGTLNMGNNTINTGTVNANISTITTVNTNSLNASGAIINGPAGLDMKNNNVTGIGQLSVNGTGSFYGDIYVNNKNITGVNTLSANSFVGSFSPSGDINLNGKNIYNANSISGNILNVTGINASGANIYGTLEMGNNTINTGNINANTGTITTVNTNSLNASGAIINGSAGLDMSNQNITNANTITATGINASGANIYGTLNMGNNTINTGNINANTSTITTVNTNSLNASGATINGPAGLDMGNQNITNANNITATGINASGANIYGTLNMGNNTINTGNINANTSTITTVNTNSLNASGATINGPAGLDMKNNNATGIGQLSVNGTGSFYGDIYVNNKNITGVNTLSANSFVGSFSPSGDINLNGKNIYNANSISGNILNVTGINASGANIYGTLNMGNNTINTGNINANISTITTINTNSLNASGANINGSAGLDMGNNNITNANNITATGINASGANIYGTLNMGNNTINTGNINANTSTITTVNTNSLNASGAIINGPAGLDMKNNNVTGIGQLSVNGTGSFYGDIYANNKNITGVNTLSANSFVGSFSPSSDINMNGYGITGASYINTANLAGTKMTGDLNVNNQNITGANVITADTINTQNLSGTTINGQLNIVTPSGELDMKYTPIKLFDNSGTKYVGQQAPFSVSGSSYTINWPSAAPSGAQVLQAIAGSSPFSTQWTTVNGGPSVISRTIYVSKGGSDSTGDGSLLSPYSSVKNAVEKAQLLSPLPSLTNPVAINVGPGVYYENNSGGIQINNQGISIIGDSIASTILIATDNTSDFFYISVPDIEFNNIILRGTTPGASNCAININCSTYGRARLSSVGISSFNTAIKVNNSGTPSAVFIENLQTVYNTTCISLNNVEASLQSSLVQGSLTSTPENTGIFLSGANSRITIQSSTIRLLETGIRVTNNAVTWIIGNCIEQNNNSIICDNHGNAQIVGCSFALNNSSSINVYCSDNETKTYLEACLFDCEDTSDNKQGTCLKCVNGAQLVATHCTLDDAVIAIQCGDSGDTNAPTAIFSGVVIRDCNTDIKQVLSGSYPAVAAPEIKFMLGSFDPSRIIISDPDTATITSLDSQNAQLSFGNTSNTITPIYQMANGKPLLPHMHYNPNFYGADGMLYHDGNTGANATQAFNGVACDNDNANYFLITGDRTKESTIKLVSDTSSTPGADTNLRGWDITKLGTGANLALKFSNSDLSGGYTAHGPNTLMELDGFNSKIKFPLSTNPTGNSAILEWADDENANLYRSATGTLKTDGNLIIKNTVQNYLAAPMGTNTNPSIIFDVNTNAGLYSPSSNNISITTSGQQRLNVNSSGIVSINSLAFSPTGIHNNGIIHSDSSGNLSSSLIVGNDIESNTIPNRALQTLTQRGLVDNNATTATDIALNGNGKIVMRNASDGSFSTLGTITAPNFTVTNAVTANSIPFGFIGNLDGNAKTATSTVTFSTPLSGDLSGGNNGTNSTVVKVGGQIAADVATATVRANAASSANENNKIVLRDNAGSFSSNIITANGFSGPLSGTVTGSLIGNASTATLATTAQNISVTGISGTFGSNITSNVSGQQDNLLVNSIGSGINNRSTAQVVQATDLALSATNINTPGISTIVRRDTSGNFATNMISLAGIVENATDAATKDYVDTQVTLGGIVPKDPALVVSVGSNVTLSGVQTIDSVTTTTAERVLLTTQTDSKENGLWLTSDTGDWYRPTDFANGSTAGKAYVLIQSGNTYAGSGWICNSPAAEVGADSIYFVQFSSPGSTTGQNIGSGNGQIFKDKTGIYLNFRKIAALTHMLIDTDLSSPNTVSIGVDATPDNNASTIVARDSNGYFSANMTGAASDNVLKDGDTMTGDLTMAPVNPLTQTQIKLQDTSGNYFVGLRAPASISGASYSIDLPVIPPTVNQVLMATSSNTPFTTKWQTIDALPTVNKTYYVSKAGNDTTGNGSFSFPYASVKKAVSQAQLASPIPSTTNPVAINVGPGVFIEQNSGGGIPITTDGINIVGNSISSTLIMAFSFATDDLFTVTTSNVGFYNLTIRPLAPYPASQKSGIKVNTNYDGKIRLCSVGLSSFKTGLEISSSGAAPLCLINDLQSMDNETAISFNNVICVLESSAFQGSSSNQPVNNCISITGELSRVGILGCAMKYFNNCITLDNKATLRVSSVDFEACKHSFICQGSSNGYLIGVNSLYNYDDSINVQAKDNGTVVYVDGSMLNCKSPYSQSIVPTGTAIKCTSGAIININSTTIENAGLGFECGTDADTDSTQIISNGVNLLNCPYDLRQRGTSILSFVGGTIQDPHIDLESPASVSFAAFRSGNKTTLSFGNSLDQPTTVYQIQNGQESLPSLDYKNQYYDSKGTVYINSNTGTDGKALNGVQSDNSDASFYAVTGDSTKEAKLSLISDYPAGSYTNTRGWTISKTGTAADLAFTFTNNNQTGYLERGPNTLMELDGFNSKIKFPLSVNPANQTATLEWAGDANANIYRSDTGTLKTNGNLAIANKILPSPGSALNPSIFFSGVTGSGIFSTAGVDVLAFSTAGEQRMSIDQYGTVSVNSLASSPTGVVHSDASGNLSSSLILNTDISPSAAISDTKLATISTIGKVANSATTASSSASGDANKIVTRDGSGNFAVSGAITANIVAKGFVGNLQGNADTATSATTAGSATIFTGQLGGDVVSYMTTTTVVTVGGQSASTVAAATIKVNAATSTPYTNSTLVIRDSSGNFAANNITATLTGSASLNVLKSGDTMSGALTCATGSDSTPSINFTNSPYTGFSAGTKDVISVSVTGAEVAAFSQAGLNMYNDIGMNTHNITGVGTLSAESILGTFSPSGDVNMNGHSITGAGTITTANLAGTTMTGNLNMGNQNITNANNITATGINASGANIYGTLNMGSNTINTGTVNATTSTIATVNTNSLNASGANINGSAGLNMNNNNITAINSLWATGINATTLNASGININGAAGLTATGPATFNATTTFNNNIAQFNAGLTATGPISFTGNVAMNNQNITGANIVNAASFVGALTGHASSDLALTGGTMLGAINMGNKNITNANTITATGINASGANIYGTLNMGSNTINTGTVNSTTATIATVNTNALNASGANINGPSGLNMNNNNITAINSLWATGINATTLNASGININGAAGLTATGPATFNATTTFNNNIAQFNAGLTATGPISFTGNVAMNNQNITGANIVNAASFVGALTGHASLDLALTGGTMSGAINMGNQNITNANNITATGINASGANIYGTLNMGSNTINTGTVNATTATIATVNTNALNASGANINGPAGLNMNNNNITAINSLWATGINATTLNASGININGASGLTATGPATFNATTTFNNNIAQFNAGLTATGPISFTGNVAMNNQNITGANIVNSASFVGALTGHASLDLALTGGTMSGAINMGNQNITNANNITATGINASGANIYGTLNMGSNTINTGTVNATTATIATVNTTTLNASGAIINGPAGLDMKNNNVTGIGQLSVNGTGSFYSDIYMNNKNITGVGTITANTFSGSYSPSGDLNMAGHNITNADTVGTNYLQASAGSSAAPSINFVGNTNTGLSASVANSLSLDASGAEIARISTSGLTVIPGSTSAPSINFNNSTNTGLSSSTAGVISLSSAGSEIAKIAGTGLGIIAGSAATPSIQFNGSTNTGFSAPNANIISIDVNGTEKATFSATGLTLNAGSAAAPSLQFVGTTNTGLSARATNILGFSSAGTEIMNIAPAGVTIPAFTSQGVVHNSNAGLLSSSKIVDSDITAQTITNTSIANNTITASQIANNTITAGQITNNTITATQIANNTITAGQIANNTITATQIANNTITATQIANNTITDTQINSSAAIANSKLAGNPQSGLGINTIVLRDGSNNFSAGTITATLSGAASANVLKTGDTMSGPLAINYISSSANAPSISLGSTGVGIYSNVANNLSFETAGAQRMNINAAGTVTIPSLTTTNGVIVNDGSGNLSSALIVGNNITDNTIPDSKLQTISTAGKVANSATTATGVNVADKIVARDSSGNFAANTITAVGSPGFIGSVSGAASLNVLKSGDTMTGALTVPDSSALSPSIKFANNTNTGLYATNSSNTLSIDANGNQVASFSSTPGVYNNIYYDLNMNNKNITGVDTITANSIVGPYSPSGDLDMNGHNITNAGTVDTNILQASAGLPTSPSINFLGNTNTGLSASNQNALSLDASGAEIARISTAGIRIIPGSTDAPSINFSNSTNTGFSCPNAGVISFDSAGSEIAKIAGTGLGIIAGSAATPSIQFNGSTNTGFSAPNANIISIDINGTEKATFSATGLTLNAGSAAAPSLQFTGVTNTGISARATNILGLSSNGTEIMNIAPAGLTIPAFTSQGVVHNNNAGLLSSSLIINSDISPLTITNASIANQTITAAQILDSTITGTKIANKTITASQIADTTITAGQIANKTITFTQIADKTISAGQIADNTITTNQISLTAGITAGQIASDTITNTQINSAANIASSKLADAPTALNTPTKIVLRDGSGNFAAGIITASGANINGSAGLNMNNNNITAINNLWATGINASGANIYGTLNMGSNTINTGTISATTVNTTNLGATTMTGALNMGNQNITNASTITATGINASGANIYGTLNMGSNTINTGTINATTSTITTVNTTTLNASGVNINGPAGLNMNNRNITSANVISATGLQMQPGLTTAPSIQFTGSTNTGICAQTPDTLSFGTSGTERATISSTGLSVTSGVVTHLAGSAGAPTMTFSGDTTTGIYSSGAGNVAVTTSGGQRANISSAGLSLSVPLAMNNNNITSANVISATGLQMQPGSGTTPSINFVGNTNTGLSSSLLNTLSLDAGGAEIARVMSTGVGLQTGQFAAPAGTNSAPSYTFNGDTNAGIYSPAADNISVSAAGTEITRITSTGSILQTGQYAAPAGTNAAPSYTFNGDTNTGMYLSTTDTTAFTAGGTGPILSVSPTLITRYMPLCDSAIQYASAPVLPATGVHVDPSTSILVYTGTGGITLHNLPANPVNGQLFTIMIGVTDTNTHAITYPPNTAVQTITVLDTNAAPSASTANSSVTYIYLTSGTIANRWYRYSRG